MRRNFLLERSSKGHSIYVNGYFQRSSVARFVIKRWLRDFEELVARVKIRELLFYAIAWNCVTDAGKAAINGQMKFVCAHMANFVHTLEPVSTLDFSRSVPWNSRRVNSSFERVSPLWNNVSQVRERKDKVRWSNRPRQEFDEIIYGRFARSNLDLRVNETFFLVFFQPLRPNIYIRFYHHQTWVNLCTFIESLTLRKCAIICKTYAIFKVVVINKRDFLRSSLNKFRKTW